MNLRPYQTAAVEAIQREWGEGRKRTLLVLPTGAGKCLGAGTPVLMHSGKVKAVEDVKVGDKLMGPDSLPRCVVSTCKGREMMYRVTPKKGKPYEVNESHILSLRRTNEEKNPVYPCQRRGGEIVNISVRDYVGKSKYFKHIHKGWRAGVDFKEHSDPLLLDPYFVGLWLGDGSSRTACICTGDAEVKDFLFDYAKQFGMDVRVEYNSVGSENIHIIAPNGGKGRNQNRISWALNHYRILKNKHVPFRYKTASRADRLQLLAGIIDTDGSYTRGGFDLCLKSRQLMDDVIFVAQSLGFSAYLSAIKRTCTNTGVTGDYFRCNINGNTEEVPCRIARKKAAPRKQKKSVLNVGITVDPIGVGNYYGFELEGPDRLFLLGDFTVTHNTICFAKLAEQRVRRGERGLILAHRGELLDQAADKIMAATGLGCSVEKADQTSWGEWFRIVVGSVQSMTRPKRLEAFPRDHFDFIIIDECHHCLADGYQRILKHFDEHANVLGVTATPDRGDLRELGTYFDSLAYEYALPQAIKDGYLCPIKALTIPIKLDMSNVKQTAGDFNAAAVGSALDPYLEQIACEMVNHCTSRKSVVFLPLIATSQKFAGMLAARGMRVAEVNGESRDRAQILSDFDRGRYDVLCNSMLLTEGWDCPSVDCIVCLRPTKIRSLYCQMVGRGTRLHPGKDHLLLLDFLWMSQKHELCRPAHLIADHAEVAAKMTENIAAAGCPVDLEEAERTAEGDCVAEREEALAKKLAEVKRRKGSLVDPLQYAMSVQAEDLASYVPTFGWEAQAPTKPQLDKLEKAGILPEAVESAGMADKLLHVIDARRSDGLATPKQIRLLERKGFQHVGGWEFDAAKKLIDRIAGNDWRTPNGIDPSTYKPVSAPKPQPEEAGMLF